MEQTDSIPLNFFQKKTKCVIAFPRKVLEFNLFGKNFRLYENTDGRNFNSEGFTQYFQGKVVKYHYFQNMMLQIS